MRKWHVSIVLSVSAFLCTDFTSLLVSQDMASWYHGIGHWDCNNVWVPEKLYPDAMG
jgi:hypothetical protein